MTVLSQIANVQYGQFATLFSPSNSVVGYHYTSGFDNQNWQITNYGNQITIFNDATQSYACVGSEYQGAAVVSSSNACNWQLWSNGGSYQIATGDGAYVWSLSSGGDYQSIVLQSSSASGGSNSLWNID